LNPLLKVIKNIGCLDVPELTSQEITVFVAK